MYFKLLLTGFGSSIKEMADSKKWLAIGVMIAILIFAYIKGIIDARQLVENVSLALGLGVGAQTVVDFQKAKIENGNKKQ